MKITLIVGLPGSGKTYLAKSLKDNKSMLIDDIKHADQLIDKGLDLIITDPYFCYSETRDKCIEVLNSKFNNPEIIWIYFENNLEKALNNIKHRKRRGDGRNTESFAEHLSLMYKIPSGVEPLVIWQKDK